jgi:hypothetical protein
MKKTLLQQLRDNDPVSSTLSKVIVSFALITVLCIFIMAGAAIYKRSIEAEAQQFQKIFKTHQVRN